MLISSIPSVATYEYTGVHTLPIPFSFYGLSTILVGYRPSTDPTDLSPYVPLIPGTDYEVTGNKGSENDGDQAFKNGSVTITEAGAAKLTAGFTVVVTRDTPIEQQFAYNELDNFPAKSHENGLSRLAVISQEIAAKLSRALMVPPGAEANGQDLLQTTLSTVFAARDAAEASAENSNTSASAAAVSAAAADTQASAAAASAAEATQSAIEAANAVPENLMQRVTDVEAKTNSATTTSRGIGRVATLADMEPDAIIENGPAFLDSELLKTAPPSGTTLNPGWIGSMLCNFREVLTTSGVYTAPVSGVYKVTCIGGGGGGGAGGGADAGYGGAGGKQGGTTTSFFNGFSAIGGSGGGGAGVYAEQGCGGGGGGGGAGEVNIYYLYLAANDQYAVTIGAGGQGGQGNSTIAYCGAAGQGPTAGKQAPPAVPGRAAAGASDGDQAGGGGGEPGPGGAGGRNGTGYGGGGGGGAGQETNRLDTETPGGASADGASYGQGTTPGNPPSSSRGGYGGNGGPGAIILEYFNPWIWQ